MAKLPLDPSLPSSDQKYALLSSVAGVAVTEADVVIKSVEQSPLVDETSGLYIDSIVLGYVGSSTVLKNTGPNEVTTTFTAIPVQKVLDLLGYSDPLTVYAKATVSSPWGLFQNALRDEIIPYIQKNYGLNVAFEDVVGKLNTGGTDTFPYPDASIEVNTFGYRGTIRLNILKEDRIDFATKFKEGVALDGFDKPATVTTLEGTEDMMTPETDESSLAE